MKISRRRFISGFGLISGCLSLMGCTGARILSKTNDVESETEIWWIGADSHVAYRQMRIRNGYENHLETCVNDVNNLGICDYAIILGDLGGGDLLNGTDLIQTDENASRFTDVMNGLNVKDWYYVTGNHEFNPNTGKIVIPPKYWAQNVFGIRFIFISDEEQGYGGYIGKEQENWLFDQLERYSRQPIFIFSHQPPDKSGSWNFWDKLEVKISNYNIQAWFHGHEHIWSIEKDTVYGFHRIGISSIYEYTGHDRFPVGDEAHHNGCFLILQKEGSVTNVRIRFRNHAKREWIIADRHKEITFNVEL